VLLFNDFYAFQLHITDIVHWHSIPNIFMMYSIVRTFVITLSVGNKLIPPLVLYLDGQTGYHLLMWGAIFIEFIALHKEVAELQTV
jgi:hypothetical protein